MQSIIERLKARLEDNVKKAEADSMLFSGGLDTSILACLAPQMNAITVTLESGGADIDYAKKAHLPFHHHRIVDIDEAMEAIPEVIKILKTFDPAIPNDLVVYFGLKLAKDLGARVIMTGDGADELFCGYGYMRNIKGLEEYVRRISQSMSFSSNTLGDFFGIKVIQPYIEKVIVDLSLSIPIEFKIRERHGKWILRKAYEDILGKDIAWQSKRPLEEGSGMTKLREIITEKVSDEEFAEKTRFYPIKFMNKEHLYYYEVYLDVVGKIPGPKVDEAPCPFCGAGIKKEGKHCKTCGGVME